MKQNADDLVVIANITYKIDFILGFSWHSDFDWFDEVILQFTVIDFFFFFLIN